MPIAEKQVIFLNKVLFFLFTYALLRFLLMAEQLIITAKIPTPTIVNIIVPFPPVSGNTLPDLFSIGISGEASLFVIVIVLIDLLLYM